MLLFRSGHYKIRFLAFGIVRWNDHRRSCWASHSLLGLDFGRWLHASFVGVVRWQRSLLLSQRLHGLKPNRSAHWHDSILLTFHNQCKKVRFPNEGSLICPPFKSMIIFTKKKTEKNWASGHTWSTTSYFSWILFLYQASSRSKIKRKFLNSG